MSVFALWKKRSKNIKLVENSDPEISHPACYPGPSVWKYKAPPKPAPKIIRKCLQLPPVIRPVPRYGKPASSVPVSSSTLSSATTTISVAGLPTSQTWVGESSTSCSSDPSSDSIGRKEEEELCLVGKFFNSSIRSSTQKSYAAYWNRFRTFCDQRNLECLPATPVTVARFLCWISESTCSVSGAKISRSAIHYNHNLYDPEAQSPTDSGLVRRIMRGLRSKFEKPVKKAKPLSLEVLKKVMDVLQNEPKDFLTLRFLAWISLSFFIFGRYSDISQLCVRDVGFEENYIQVIVSKAKNFEMYDPRTSYVARNEEDEHYCVVSILDSYLDIYKPSSTSALLFPSSPDDSTSEVSYNFMLSKFREVLQSVGVGDFMEYSMHSPRSGGLSQAFASGVFVLTFSLLQV